MNSIERFPQEIVDKMLEHQVAQGNLKDIKVFQMDRASAKINGGFDWDSTPEKSQFWNRIIIDRNFDVFFQKYPKLTLPRLVEVRNNESSRWVKRVLVLIRKVGSINIYYCIADTDNLERSNWIKTITPWNCMREIEEPKVTELTIDEIAQKFNIPVEQLKIKK